MSKTKKLLPEVELSQLSLTKFCSKKLLEVEFLEPFTKKDNKFVNDIAETGKKYEHLSDVYFITYGDVWDLIERLGTKDADVYLPTYVKEAAQQLLSVELTETSISLDFLGLMTKVKIIESLYKVYTREVLDMQRRNRVNEELNELLKNCEETGKKKGKGGKGGKPEKSKSSKAEKSGKSSKGGKSQTSKKQSTISELVDDYTTIKLEENETIFDYNVDNHLIYVALCGFPDPLILQKLIENQVGISVILDISVNSSEEPCDVILKMQELFETPQKSTYLENTAWMKYRRNSNTNLKDTFEEVLYVIKRINYIKRQHFSYIKSLKLVDLGATHQKLSSSCLEKYNRILDAFPCQLINVPLIVGALVKEVSWRAAGSIHTLSDLSSSSVSEEDGPKKVKSFQTHEEDFLKMGMRAYGDVGRKCYDQSLEYMKLLKPLSKFVPPPKKRYKNSAVSTLDACFCDNSSNIIDYYYLAIFTQMKRTPFVVKDIEEYEFTENLVTYDQAAAYKKALPKGYVDCGEENNQLIRNYHMKEDLSTAVLRQLIFKVLGRYSCWDRFYCDNSKAVLLRFHDNVNDYGIDTKIWEQSLRTPVCLRDFCRFATNDEKAWLQENKLVEFDLNPDNSEEECKGLIDLHVPEVYQEYQYLLAPESGISSNQKKDIFNEIINELLTYPTSDRLVKFCNQDGTLWAYNLGPKQCQLTGQTTIFQSDDDVKITVDTTRFMVEDQKCTIKVESDDNTLVFHKQKPSTFHFIQKDGTLISFSEFETNVETCTPVSSTENVTNETQSVKEEEEEEDSEIRVPNYNDYWVQVLRKSKIPTTIPGFFNQPTIEDKRIKLDDLNLDKLLELFKAAVFVNNPIYKISTKPSIQLLKRTTSPLKVPLVHTLKRILFKPKRRRRKIGGYSVLHISKKPQDIPMKYDFKIVLPNGLLITTLPRNRPYAEVKQEYKYSSRMEQYRIFYANGLIVIKNVDGTTTAYRSNGDIITLTNDPESYSENCAKNITRVFQNEEEEVCPHRKSRHTDFLKVKARTDCFKLGEFQDVPYSNKTLLEFEGMRTHFCGNKVTEKQEYFVINEHDYHTEEVFFEREDGMKCIIRKKGQHVYQFTDGTKITSTPKFEKELIFIGGKFKSEGWVSVFIEYKYEHPDYVTVQYDYNRKKERATVLFLKDSVVKQLQNSFLLFLNKEITLEVTSKDIIFLKKCAHCDTDCITEIHLDKTPTLLESYDSYEKYLSCDSFGKCEIYSDFIKSSVNKNNCDHVLMNEKHKFFILNERGPPGTVLWKDSSIEDKILESKNCKNIKVSNYMNKLLKKQTLEFFTEIQQNFTGRFTRSQEQRDICLSKYKHGNPSGRIFYVTYRILIEFQNLLEHSEILSELEEYLNEQVEDNSVQLLVNGIKQLVHFIIEYENGKQDMRSSYQVSMKEEQDSTGGSSLSRSVDLDRTRVQDIIGNWRNSCEEYKYLIRNKKFPCYFKSDYYNNEMKNSAQVST